VRNRSVAIEPGLMALTRTPSRTPRSASALVRFRTAALTAPPMVNSALPVAGDGPAARRYLETTLLGRGAL
jgi:hypothetical protein